MRGFTLKGTAEENFRKLEKVIPRIITNTTPAAQEALKPPSPLAILHHYCDTPDKGIIFKGIMFTGRITSVCIGVDNIEGNVAPTYYCSIVRGPETRTVRFQTMKKSYVGPVNLEVFDGDRVEIGIENPTIAISGIYVSVKLELTTADVRLIG